MHVIPPRPPLATKLAAATAMVVLGLSLALSGCGRHPTNDGPNAGAHPGTTTTTSQTGGATGGSSLGDLQSLSDSLNADMGSLGTDEAAATNDQSGEDQEVQP